MTRGKRKVLLTAAVAALGVGAVPIIAPGTASAQTNSRLCGRYWHSDKTGETVTRFYEVSKISRNVCDLAHVLVPVSTSEERGPEDSPFQIRDESWKARENPNWGDGVNHWSTSSFRFVVCEGDDPSSFTQRPVEFGGRGGRNLNFIGDNFPTYDQYDICNNMDRSDTTFEMEAYWLYDDNISAPPEYDWSVASSNPNDLDFERG